VDQARRCPLHVGTMRGGHVAGDRGEAALAAVADMAGHALAPMHQLHHCYRDARFQLLADQRLRNAVTVAFDLDVVIDVYLNGLEVRHLVAL